MAKIRTCVQLNQGTTVIKEEKAFRNSEMNRAATKTCRSCQQILSDNVYCNVSESADAPPTHYDVAPDTHVKLTSSAAQEPLPLLIPDSAGFRLQSFDATLVKLVAMSGWRLEKE